MPTTIILVRHAQSVWNAAGRWQGHANPELSEMGRAQARLVAERLSHWPVSHVYGSDLQRAAETAAAIAAARGLTAIIDPLWRERHIGDWEGLTMEEIRERYPADVEQMNRGQHVTPPNAEPTDAIYERATRAFQTLLARHPGEMTVAVSHGGTISAVLTAALGLGDTGPGLFSIRGHTGISVIEAGQHRNRLLLLNDTGHLSLITPP